MSGLLIWNREDHRVEGANHGSERRALFCVREVNTAGKGMIEMSKLAA